MLKDLLSIIYISILCLLVCIYKPEKPANTTEVFKTEWFKPRNDWRNFLI